MKLFGVNDSTAFVHFLTGDFSLNIGGEASARIVEMNLHPRGWGLRIGGRSLCWGGSDGVELFDRWCIARSDSLRAVERNAFEIGRDAARLGL